MWDSLPIVVKFAVYVMAFGIVVPVALIALYFLVLGIALPFRVLAHVLLPWVSQLAPVVRPPEPPKPIKLSRWANRRESKRRQRLGYD